MMAIVNKNSWLWVAPEYFNRWRVFPRAFITFYFWLAYKTAIWFMELPEPSTAQAAFASAIISAGAAWFGLYVNSGPKISSDTGPPTYNQSMYSNPQYTGDPNIQYDFESIESKPNTPDRKNSG